MKDMKRWIIINVSERDEGDEEMNYYNVSERDEGHEEMNYYKC